MISKIKPSPKEKIELENVSKKLLQMLKKEVNGIDDRIKVELLGSASRDTWLKDEKDLDIFLLFPVEYSKKELEGIVTKAGKKVLENTEKRFAEHPYIRGFYDNFEVEIVPCYAVPSAMDLKSAVDRTPFHDSFVKQHIRGKEDEVRLLKQFLKGIRCYGAEAKVEGFSGYLCELLIIRYGSFKKMLEEAGKWTPPQILWMGEKPKATLLKKFETPLVFIDPIDSNRNVASALSYQKFSEFIYAANAYLKKPGEEFLFPKDRTAKRKDVLNKFRKRGTQLIGVIFFKPDTVDDILYPQLRKFLATLRNYVREGDFEILGMDFFVRDNVCLVIELSRIEIPPARFHTGPYVNSRHEEMFLEKYQGYRQKLTEPFIEGNRWRIILKRKYGNAVDYLNDLLSQKNLEEKGIPSYISKSLNAGFRIKVNEAAILDEFLQDFLNYFDPAFPWEV